tara:strand:- start:395 stop:685 length:291 start_codon:yes stop_codon:yes gene_type:complete
MDMTTLIQDLGLPVAMLIVAIIGITKLFSWLSTDLMNSIKNNEQRLEGILIKLIDNSKLEREQNRQNFNEILVRIDSIVNLMVKLTGNGLKNKEKE